jgi:hypothetical protein
MDQVDMFSIQNTLSTPSMHDHWSIDDDTKPPEDDVNNCILDKITDLGGGGVKYEVT